MIKTYIYIYFGVKKKYIYFKLENTIKYIDNNTYDIILVGSSLGGYYSIYIGEKYNLKTILINPSV